MWRWSYDVLERSCDEVIFVVPGSYVDALSAEGIGSIAGGATRQASVSAGLARVSSDRVVVHDAARPLVTSELIAKVVDALERADGATAAIPVRDTLVRVDKDLLESPLEREHLWRVQTPQAFHTDALQEAHRRALADGVTDASDDTQLLRAIGRDVAVVRGDERNMKATDPGDLKLIEALLDEVR